MKKLIVMTVVAAMAVGAYARGCGGGPRGPGGCGPCRPCGPGWGGRPCGPGWGPRPCGPGWGPGDWWGRGGCNFWPGFVGGVVGGLAYSSWSAPYYRDTVVVQSSPTVVTQPVVVQQPTVVTQPVVVQQQALPAVQTTVTQVQNVWIPGQYIDQVQANGSTVRVWNPGHYEQRAY